MPRLKTPYADLLPPLSTEEFEALKADIEANGVLQAVLIDESGNVLDGHHRYKIDPDAPTKIIEGLSEADFVMNTRGDCPDSLRRTALSWAVQLPPDGRTRLHHELIVWCNFCDVFNDRAEFERLVARRRFFKGQRVAVKTEEF